MQSINFEYKNLSWKQFWEIEDVDISKIQFT